MERRGEGVTTSTREEKQVEHNFLVAAISLLPLRVSAHGRALFSSHGKQPGTPRALLSIRLAKRTWLCVLFCLCSRGKRLGKRGRKRGNARGKKEKKGEGASENMEGRRERNKKTKRKKKRPKNGQQRLSYTKKPRHRPSSSLSFFPEQTKKTAERAHRRKRSSEKKRKRKLSLFQLFTWPWPPTAASSRAAAWSACAPSRPPSPRAPPSPTASAPRGTGSTCKGRCGRARGRCGGAA